MSENVKELSDSSFEAEILQSEIPAVVDFWAPWCGPCKSIAPVLEELAEQFAGKVKITKMNVDDNPETPTRFDVRGIPNIVFFKDGQVVNQVVGAVPKEHLLEALEKLL